MRQSFKAKVLAATLCLSISLTSFHVVAALGEFDFSSPFSGAAGKNYGPFSTAAGGPSTGIAGLPSGASNPPIDGIGGSLDSSAFGDTSGVLQDPNAVPCQGGKKDSENDKASPCEIDQSPTQSCENGMSGEQTQVANENGMDLSLIMMLMSLFDKDSSSSSSSDSSSVSGTVIKYIEVPTFIYNGKQVKPGDDLSGGGNKGDGTNGDGTSGNNSTGTTTDDDDKKGQSGGDPSDLTDYTNQQNQIKNKFKSAIPEVTDKSTGATNDVERAILTAAPQTPSRLTAIRSAAIRDPAEAAKLVKQKVVWAPKSSESSDSTQRDRQVLRIVSYAEAFGIGVASVAAVNSLGNSDLPAAAQSAQEAARQNGISKIKRALAYTLTANNKAAMGRVDAIEDLGTVANYAGTGSKGSIVPDNAGECPVCPPPGQCSVCETSTN